MSTIELILLSISILLFISSFFMKDRYRTLEKDMDELSLNFLQENYQLKKRIKILEEELMVDSDYDLSLPTQVKKSAGKAPIHQIVKNQVIALYKQGTPIDQIAKQSALSLKEVKEIISNQ